MRDDRWLSLIHISHMNVKLVMPVDIFWNKFIKGIPDVYKRQLSCCPPYAVFFYPFTAPAATPATNRRWKITYTRITGRMDIEVAANRPP